MVSNQVEMRNTSIHVIRDPKDVEISFFRMTQGIYNISESDIDSFIDISIKGTGLYDDYSDTVKSYWKERNNPK